MQETVDKGDGGRRGRWMKETVDEGDGGRRGRRMAVLPDPDHHQETTNFLPQTSGRPTNSLAAGISPLQTLPVTTTGSHLAPQPEAMNDFPGPTRQAPSYANKKLFMELPGLLLHSFCMEPCGPPAGEEQAGYKAECLVSTPTTSSRAKPPTPVCLNTRSAQRGDDSTRHLVP